MTDTQSPAYRTVRAALDRLVEQRKIRAYGLSTKGRFYIRLNDEVRLPNLTLVSAARFVNMHNPDTVTLES